MQQLIIQGGRPLEGNVRISGSKNTVLPILAATLLCREPVLLANVPHLEDVTTMVSLLARLGAHCDVQELDRLHLDTRMVNNTYAPYDLVKRMRASVLVLGSLLARYGEARVSLPGGCAIGQRPIDFHISGLRALGASVEIEKGDIVARCKRLKGARIVFDIVTVTGTENLLMSAVLAEGQTVLQNAACEPEVIDLANFLNGAGARITGAGSEMITIDGVDQLGGGEFHVSPDRIEASTYLTAAALTGGRVTVQNVKPGILDAVMQKLRMAGAELEVSDTEVTVEMDRRPKVVDIVAAPYPAFPTDMQAQITVLNSIGEGAGQVVENVFENRFMHVQELNRMGADIHVVGNVAFVRGVDKLFGTHVMATGPARLGLFDSRRPRRPGRDGGAPRLPHRPRLRMHRGETAPARRRHHPPRRSAMRAPSQ